MARRLLAAVWLGAVLIGCPPRLWADPRAAAAAAAAPAWAPVPVPAPSEKALRYYRSGMVLWAVRQGWELLVPGVILFSGFSARLRTWAGRWGRRWFILLAIYTTLYAALTWVLDLPLDYYAGFARQHAYGLSTQTLGRWWGDALKSLLVVVAGGVALLWLPYLGLHRAPRRWWLITGLLTAPVMCLLMLIAPLWIEPLFNDFGPMKNRALEREILALAARAGIEGGRVFEVNKSVDTKAVNAYVTGFGGTKRIVLWDTLIAKLGREPLLFVMGHEMGHYVLGHVWKSILLGAGLALVVLYVLDRAARGLVARCHTRFGFHRLDDVASFPLFLLLIQVCLLLLAPLTNAYSRHLEHEADRFGLELTQDNHAAATGFVGLQEANLSNPRPGWLYRWWRADHPSLGERIDFCNRYRPWQTGQPLRYGARFGPSAAP